MSTPLGRILRHRPFASRPSSEIAYYDSLVDRVRPEPGLVVFESMQGWQYSDSPRAIYEELTRQRVPFTPVWSVRADAVGLPHGLRTVQRHTRDWYLALASARVWIDNQGFPAALRKPRHTSYLQTWHGTPLKQLGWDQRAFASAPPREHERVAASVARWDAVTVASDYFATHVVEAFRADAEILRLGSPRNDRLLRPRDPLRHHDALADLGLHERRRTVLYAPTSITAGHEQLIDDAFWTAFAGRDPRFQVMRRRHYVDASPEAAQGPRDPWDYSLGHDMAELLDVADILVTDYSSVLFDFALTDRPVILYQPDRAEYADKRGLNFDIAAFAPGPIVTTLRELEDRITGVDDWADDWSQARAEYRARFGQYEQGNAAERTVTEHLAPVLRQGSG